MAEINFEKMAEGFAKSLKEKGFFVSRWIPISERLPEVGHRVIFGMKNGEIYIGTLHMLNNDLKITLEPTGIVYVYSFENVIAWMPLPKPYKAEGSDKE